MNLLEIFYSGAAGQVWKGLLDGAVVVAVKQLNKVAAKHQARKRKEFLQVIFHEDPIYKIR